MENLVFSHTLTRLEKTGTTQVAKIINLLLGAIYNLNIG